MSKKNPVVNIDQLLAQAECIPLPNSPGKHTKETMTTDCLIAGTGALGRIYESRASFLNDLSQTLGSAQKQGLGLSPESSRALCRIFHAWGNDCVEFNRYLAWICRIIVGDAVLLENGAIMSPQTLALLAARRDLDEGDAA